MKLGKYLKDNIWLSLLFILTLGISWLIFLAFKCPKEVIISLTIILIIFFCLALFIPFIRKNKFYTELLANIDALDKSYLVLETLVSPDFYEGELLCQALYAINKSMNENVKLITKQFKDFQEYIEMWVHEVKIPLATLELISNNHQDKFDNKTKLQLKKLEDYVNQVLYYARCKNAEKDYLIKETNLAKIIKNVGVKNMVLLLEKKIDYKVLLKKDIYVLTDAKWLEFILEQIINNSIKYKRKIKNAYIKIEVKEEIDKTILMIEDNGIGIKEADLKQVFTKSFTGQNGRDIEKSTGMGLYIAKSMCQKLGHKIAIQSVWGEYTKVFITFAKDKFYEVVK